MGTRGFVGVVIDGVEHLAYNGMSSGPADLGRSVLAEVRDLTRRYSPVALRDLAARLHYPGPVEEFRDGTYVVTTPGRSVRAEMAANPAFAAHVTTLLAQGQAPRNKTLDDTDEETWRWWADFTSLDEMLTIGVYEPNRGFPLLSGHCEWGYLLDLDRDHGPDRPPGVLEVYRGFQCKPPVAGRWAGRPSREEEAEWYAEHTQWCLATGRTPWLPPVPEYKAVAPVAVWALDSLPEAEAMEALYQQWADETLAPLADTSAA